MQQQFLGYDGRQEATVVLNSCPDSLGCWLTVYCVIYDKVHLLRSSFLCIEQLKFVCVVMSVLLPSGGYKGYGLGMMVEVFCGILAGAQYSNRVRTWKVTDRVANLVRFVCVVF